MKNHVLLMIIFVIAVGAGAFFGGMQYEKSKGASMVSQYAQTGGFGGGMRRFGGRNGMGATVGKIVSADATSITVQLNDGSSKIVNISNTTKVNKTVSGSTSDLTNGQTVAAVGATNSDGSVTATTILLNPGMGMRGGGTGQQASPSSTQGQ